MEGSFRPRRSGSGPLGNAGRNEIDRFNDNGIIRTADGMSVCYVHSAFDVNRYLPPWPPKKATAVIDLTKLTNDELRELYDRIVSEFARRESFRTWGPGTVDEESKQCRDH